MLEDYVTGSVSDSAPKITTELLPGRSPLKLHMRSSDIRMQTFTKNWPVKGHATSRKMADAGFYYLGDSERITCFYCAGGLENRKLDDNPWCEHAKWYLTCEYVLRNQGVDCVKNVCLKHMKLLRLKINNNAYKSVAVESLHEILNGHVSGSVKLTDPKAKKQRAIELELKILVDPHVAYAA